MKSLLPLPTLALSVFAAPLFAQTFETLDDATILLEINNIAAECAQMNDGEQVEEIFGIMLTREGDKCILGPGDVSPRFGEFLSTTGFDGAGMHDVENIWIAITQSE